MDDQRISVIAEIQVKRGFEEKVKKELLALVSPTRSEQGCITYVLHCSADDPAHFMFYEHWVRKSDLDEHLKRPYIRAFMEKAGKLLKEPVKITLWKMIG